ncbi:MAG: hypothetical protein C0436_05025 [Alphaproteobacteria bacterium]|nr:hypothetical protein [Alphaproteobacteria bacterium]
MRSFCFDACITAARARFYGLFFVLLTCITVAGIVVTAQGPMDAMGRPIGTDFAGIWSAGVMTRTQGPEQAYDFAAHNALQRNIFGEETLPLGYHYPPIFTLVVEPLSRLPYLPALIVYQLVGFALYWLTMRHILSAMPHRLWGWPVLGFPAIWVNLTHAHNGFLTAALFGGGLVLLRTRPWLAGILLGALCYKPQFGLLIPLALMAAGQWRAFISASITVLALIAFTLLLYGESTWLAFFRYSEFTQREVIEGGTTGWHKMQTVFAAARLWHAPITLAYALHALVACVVSVMVWRVWRSHADYALKAAMLMLGALLVAPYAFDYDLMLLGPAIGFLAVYAYRHATPHLPSLLVLLWAMPFFARMVAQYLWLPLGVFSIALAALFIARTAGLGRTLSTSPPTA